MQKQLLEQVQKALHAQEDTIRRQNQMLDDKDTDIARLQKLLEQLTTTQTEQLQHLPTLYESLKNTIREQKSYQSNWLAQVSEQMQTMNTLMSESMKLSERQIQLIELMKQFQSTIVPPEKLESVTQQLENELDDLASSQQKITSRQKSLEEQQQQLQKLLQQ